MICSSVNLDRFIRPSLPWGGLSLRMVEFQGVTSSAFAGLSRVRQHQLVYAALKGKMGGELHALALETAAPKDGER